MYDWGRLYLDVKVLINFDCSAKNENELHCRGEFPHIPYPLK